MNDNTAKLLEQLAQKLGTTSQYLWSVLLKQAPISATTSLIQIIGILLFGLILWNTHKHLLKKKEGDNRYHNLYGQYEDAAGIPMILGALVFAILFVVAMFYGISNTINGYFNPEYWALGRVLDAIK